MEQINRAVLGCIGAIRRSISPTSLVVLALLPVALLPLVSAPPADASSSFAWTGVAEVGQLTAPDLSSPANWTSWQVDFAPDVGITDVTVAPDHRVGLLEGAVACGSGEPQPFSDLAANGSALWNIVPGGDPASLDGCVAPFYDHQGNAYFSGMGGGGGHHLVSYDASGHLRWSEPLLYGLNFYVQQVPANSQFYDGPYPSGPGDIAEGADGNIYLLDGRDTGEFSSGSGLHLRSFNAQTGAPGLDIDLVTVVAASQDASYPGALLQTTSTGILVGTNQGARFYSYDGQLQWDQSYWGSNSEIPDLAIRDRTPDGGLLAADRYDVAGKCTGPSSYPAQVVIRLDKITAKGLAWSVTIPSGTTGTCEDLGGPLRVHGTPDGGAVIADYALFQGDGRTVTGVGPDGHIRWTIPVDNAALEDVRVGADGTAVIIMHTTRPCATYYTCGRLVLRPVSATTGLPTAADVVIDTPDPSSSGAASNGVNPYFPEFLNAVADTDRLVIAYATTDDPSNPNPQYFRVEAVSMPGLGSDVAFNSSPPIPSTGAGGGGGGSSGGGSGSGPGSGGSGGEETYKIPVVLVPGLKETSKQVLPGGSCEPKNINDFTYLCQALTDTKTFGVYVVSASEGGREAILNNIGDLNTNAKALTLFLRTTVRQPALLVGHSMGGLIARIAISRYHAPAAGLVTIGTPHDGSFLADAAESLASLPCAGNKICTALQTALHTQFPVDSPAVWEMTGPARALDQMAPPGVPTWAFAGTAINPFNADDGYVFPDDLAVGSSSAWGESANLPNTRLEGALYHAPPAEFGLGFLHLQGDNEFHSPIVINAVISAARQVSMWARGAMVNHKRMTYVARFTHNGLEAKTASSHRTKRRRHKAQPVVVSMPLFGVETARHTAHTVKLSIRGLVIAAQEFNITCNGLPGRVPVLAPGVFGLDTSELRCATTVTLPRGSTFVVATAPPGVNATVSRNDDLTTVTVRTKQRVSSANVQFGKRRLRARRTSSGLRVSLRLPSFAQATLTVTLNGHAYRGIIP